MHTHIALEITVPAHHKGYPFFHIGSRWRGENGLFFVGERDVPFGGVRQCFAREFVCAEKIEIGGVSGLDLIGGLEDDLRQFYGKNGIFREAAKRRPPPRRPRPETAVADCLKGKVRVKLRPLASSMTKLFCVLPLLSP